jgi:hypothetical protein
MGISGWDLALCCVWQARLCGVTTALIVFRLFELNGRMVDVETLNGVTPSAPQSGTTIQPSMSAEIPPGTLAIVQMTSSSLSHGLVGMGCPMVLATAIRNSLQAIRLAARSSLANTVHRER